MDVLKGRDYSNDTLSQLLGWLERIISVSTQLEPPKYSKEEKYIDKDVLSLQILSLVPKSKLRKDPFEQMFGKKVAMDAPPVNKPKDKFGFDF
jgi:hypothetical protein